MICTKTLSHTILLRRTISRSFSQSNVMMHTNVRKMAARASHRKVAPTIQMPQQLKSSTAASQLMPLQRVHSLRGGGGGGGIQTRFAPPTRSFSSSLASSSHSQRHNFHNQGRPRRGLFWWIGFAVVAYFAFGIFGGILRYAQ